MNEIRILVLTTMYPNSMYNNSGIFIHNQIKHLLKEGCRVKVISPIPYAPKMLWFNPKWKSYGHIPMFDTIDGVPIYYSRYINLPGEWFYSLSFFSIYSGINKVIGSIIKDFKPHIIHTHGVTPVGYVGLKLSGKYQLPLVCSLRGSDINIYPHYGKLSMYITKKVLAEADQLLSVSNALKSAANHIAHPQKEIRVIYNGCDFDSFIFRKEDRKQIRDKLGIPENHKLLIFIGSISKDKGIFNLIDAFIEVKSRNSDLHLLIVGDGPERFTIEKIIYSQNLNKKVFMIGEQPHDEISKLLSAADIFVLPTYSEGLPNVILEAMACSLPVIATRVGGIPEAVEEGVSGILINKKDVDTLAWAIEYLIKNEVLAKEMGINGRKIIEHKFSWQKNVEDIIEIYKEVINAKDKSLHTHHGS